MTQMTAWTKDELRKIAETDDLHISPFREDGKTYGCVRSVLCSFVLLCRSAPNPSYIERPSDAAGVFAIWPGSGRFVRQHARRIGIAGFSAGGGVVMGAVMHHDARSRPDFAAPIYAGYRTATPVLADASPLFIALTDDDKLAAPISGARLYEAWHAAGKSAELHVLAQGEHGFGMKKQNLPSDAWIDLFKTWLGHLGYLAPTANDSPDSRRSE
jgi:hypothetical protein